MKCRTLALLLALCLFVSSVFAKNSPNYIVTQYFGIWVDPGQIWEQKFRDDTPFDKLTRLNLAFAKLVKKEDQHFSMVFDGEIDHVNAIK